MYQESRKKPALLILRQKKENQRITTTILSWLIQVSISWYLKGPLNVCVCMRACVRSCVLVGIHDTFATFFLLI